MKIYRKKRALTLLEIMIVIMLIGLIGSVIGVNMKRSMDEGRVFKTKRAQEQIRDILTLEVARGTPVDEVIEHRREYLDHSGLVKNGENFLKDGWNQEFVVKSDGRNGNIIVSSERLKAYEQKKRAKLGKTATPDETEEDDE